MSKFNVGDLVQVGTHEHLPPQSQTPLYGRVICTDARNDANLSVITLIEKNGAFDDNDNEAMYQFGSDGKCYLAMVAGKNGSAQLENNLYHKSK